ncbi:MAG: NAD(P)-dependent oxidoreductase [Gammaproteobacteria bacterium]|nr:MAG: NAD(P)-dependent oxidoreductase [Gammaproteobacteria bacterium]
MGVNTLKDTTIGFVGLGLMGKPMSRNLHNAEARVVVHNRSRPAMDELAAEGMATADTPVAVAEQADIVVLMVSDTPAVEQVLFGPEGLSNGLGSRHLVVDMGTTAASPTRGFAARVGETGAAYVDAPVSGGQLGAESGNLTIRAGGTEAAVDRARPIFEVLGQRVTHVGDVGAGQVAKAANAVIVGLNIGAVAEALSLARSAGVDPAKVREALAGGFADSRILEVHGLRMVEGSFAPGGKVKTQHKDLTQALELAAEYGLELPATRLNRELYAKLIAAGGGDLDHSALIKVLGATKEG